MSLISKRGQEVKDAVNRDDIDLKKVYIRLKDGQSVRVRLLGVQDYVQYKAHANGFNFGIYTQPCLAPTGVECPLCKAYEHDKEEYKDLRPSNRYLVAMADLDEGMIRVWDCSKTQLRNLIAQIEEYAAPIISKKAIGELAVAYHKFDDMAIEDSFFEGCLLPRSESIIMNALKQAGIPVEEIFPDYVFEDADNAGEAEEMEDDNMPF